MFEREAGDAPAAGSTAAAGTGSMPAERVMRIAPLDLRQQRFKKAMSGYDRTEVVAFLTEAADDYEHALREIDRLRQDLGRMESALAEHRSREENLRNTLMTAQRLSDEVKGAAQKEAELIVREAEGRAGLLLQNASNRLESIERDINELRLRRRDVEGSLEASIQALQRALEFVREQDTTADNVRLHRPRQPETAPAAQPAEPRTFEDRRYRQATRVPIPLSSSDDGVAFAVRVIPRAGRTGVAGIRGTALLVRLAAPPVDGAANDALVAFLADLLGRPKRDVVIVSGQASRDKRVAVAGLTPAAVAARLDSAVPVSSRDGSA